ncbi:MAG: GspH/FimT family pseudopilin [Candidatus Thiodiazotropha sp. (ex Ustalcina ferruginea)]|nr:GspH/FimT family pseudopilin [Candidatus Thiodiazotropha sp. (ex Ustalcina ferruginea)]
MYRKKGFTLIELMIAIVIGAILLTIGIPGFLNMVQRNAVTTTSNELLASLLLARSEAVRQELNTTFTLEADGWEVDTGAINQINNTVANDNITLAGNLSTPGDIITYNSMGRAALVVGDSIDVSFDGEVLSHVCLSINGRPYIKSESEGDCP